jgi:hypothetical protein
VDASSGNAEYRRIQALPFPRVDSDDCATTVSLK